MLLTSYIANQIWLCIYPVRLAGAPFKGLPLVKAAETTAKLRTDGEKVDLLNPITINDKVGTVSLFFEWAKARDSSVVNPVAGLRVQTFALQMTRTCGARARALLRELMPYFIIKQDQAVIALAYKSVRRKPIFGLNSGEKWMLAKFDAGHDPAGINPHTAHAISSVSSSQD